MLVDSMDLPQVLRKNTQDIEVSFSIERVAGCFGAVPIS